MAKFDINGIVTISPPALLLYESKATYESGIKAVAIDAEQGIHNPNIGIFDIQPVVNILAILGLDYSTIPRITKEQFYSLE